MSSFLQREAAFLGHLVWEGGRKCDPSKIGVVEGWPVPHDVGEVCSFLGLASYYHRFMNDFFSTAIPLNALTEKVFIFTVTGSVGL